MIGAPYLVATIDDNGGETKAVRRKPRVFPGDIYRHRSGHRKVSLTSGRLCLGRAFLGGWGRRVEVTGSGFKL